MHSLMVLIGEATEFRANDPARVRHLVSGFRKILHAAVATCVTDLEPSGPGHYVSSVRDGWDDSTLPALRQLEREGSIGHPCCSALTRLCPMQVAATVTARRQDVVVSRAWDRSAYVQECLLPTHLDHPLFSRRRLEPPSAIQGFGFYRAKGDPPFEEDERNLLHLFHSACGGMLQPPSATVFEALRARLSPSKEQTLDLLLAGHSDKEIAHRRGISPYTVNCHSKAIYRHFGVHSRAELIAQLLRQSAPASFRDRAANDAPVDAADTRFVLTSARPGQIG
jgi:DNA-binding CsgD family transcriptional regulator